MLNCLLAGDSKLLTAILTAVCKHAAAIGSCHTLTKSVLIFSFGARRLECTFHCSSLKMFRIHDPLCLFPLLSERAAKMPSIPVNSNQTLAKMHPGFSKNILQICRTWLLINPLQVVRPSNRRKFLISWVNSKFLSGSANQPESFSPAPSPASVPTEPPLSTTPEMPVYPHPHSCDHV